MYRPKVSIVIPAYNASNYLAEAIDSALAQTYTDTEIIVVNDGSNDNNATREVALAYGNKIKYFEKENGGSSSALNMGISHMTGEWFSWLSHDDLYKPEKLEEQIDYINNQNLDLENAKNNVYFSAYELINAQGKTFRKNNIITEKKFAKMINLAENNSRFIAEPSKYIFHGCSCLIHSSVFEKIGKFNESLRFLNDVDFWFRLYTNGYKINYMPKILVKGRVHAKQISRSIGFSYHNSEQDMHWKRCYNWLVDNTPEDYALFVNYGKDAFLKTRNINGDEAFNYALKLNPGKHFVLMATKTIYKSISLGKNIIRKLYLKFMVRS